jgi:hypothetical protein
VPMIPFENNVCSISLPRHVPEVENGFLRLLVTGTITDSSQECRLLLGINKITAGYTSYQRLSGGAIDNETGTEDAIYLGRNAWLHAAHFSADISIAVHDCPKGRAALVSNKATFAMIGNLVVNFDGGGRLLMSNAMKTLDLGFTGAPVVNGFACLIPFVD